MQIKEFLWYTSSIPYNSAYSDLPRAYSGDLRYGLDCFSFAELTTQYFQGAREIIGTYDNGVIHAATIIDNLFVDAFLRLSDAIEIDRSSNSASTYYSNVRAVSELSRSGSQLDISMVWNGVRKIKTYTYVRDAQNTTPRQPHGYKYSFLHNGRNISIIKKKSIGNTTNVEISGEHPENVEKILRKKYKLSVDDVARMFFDAGQNSQYQSSLSRW